MLFFLDGVCLIANVGVAGSEFEHTWAVGNTQSSRIVLERNNMVPANFAHESGLEGDKVVSKRCSHDFDVWKKDGS